MIITVHILFIITKINKFLYQVMISFNSAFIQYDFFYHSLTSVIVFHRVKILTQLTDLIKNITTFSFFFDQGESK